MPLPVYEIADLAAFKGMPEEYFGAYGVTALDIASFLIGEIVDIEDIDPANTRLNRLFKYAVLEITWQLYRGQEFSDMDYSPLAGESIGSYSYSKGSAAARAKAGDWSNLTWLKLLKEYLDELLGGSRSNIQHGAVSGFENDNVRIYDDGSRRIASPNRDIGLFDTEFGDRHGNGSVGF